MYPSSLFPPQQEVLDHGILELGFSAVLCLPTGAGKTTLAEIGMDNALARGERVAYLTPLKALAEEKISAWRNRWQGRKVGIFTGDYESSAVPVPYRDAQVLICTYERLDGILRHWQRHLDWLANLGLVVVDEFHLLMDPSRGPRLEGTISRLRRVNPFCRVLGLSATLSNHAELASWLEGVSYHSLWRAVPLKHEVRRYKRLADKPDLIAAIVAETAQSGGQTLVFASSRRRAEHLAAHVIAAGHTAAHHHAGLGLTRRREIESAFRAGDLACLVATPTLEMGLNLPCRTVVIADNTRWNGETFAPLPFWNYLQRAGRAGRPGQDGSGRAVLLAPAWARNVPNYGCTPPEPVRSHLTRAAPLAEQILIEVASRACRTRAQLAWTFLPSTLAYRQDPTLTQRFTACVDDLLSSRMMKEDPGAFLHATPVGWVGVRRQLSPATVKHLLQLTPLSQAHPLTDFDLLLHHCWDPDLQPQLPVAIENVEALEALIQPIPSVILDTEPPTTLPPRTCAAGVQMAVVAWQYVTGQAPSVVCERLDVYPTDAEVLRESLLRLLQASTEVQATLDPVTHPAEQRQRERLIGPSLTSRLHRLALQLEHGLPGDAVYLTLIPGCGGRLARHLLDAGITDLEELCNQGPTDLAALPGIGPKRAQAWISAALDLVQDLEPAPLQSAPHRPRALVAPSDWPHDIDTGRLRRAVSLTVVGAPPTYWVSGGADEHRVNGVGCDCADYAHHGPGWWCKHRLAVRLTNRDPQLQNLLARLSDLRPPPTLAGHLADLALGRRWHHG